MKNEKVLASANEDGTLIHFISGSSNSKSGLYQIKMVTC